MEFIDLTGLVKTERVFNFDFSTMALLRCIEKKYAKDFRNGKVFFGKPINWINAGIKGDRGQGDKLEGTFLVAKEDDSSDFIKNLKKNENLAYIEDDGFIYFRKKGIENLYCLCLYGLHDNSFKERNIDETGKVHYISRVGKQYFSDFAKNITREMYENIEDENKKAVIFICNPHKFFERIKNALKKIGVKEEEIIISPVEYVNRREVAISVVGYPRELLLKDKYFSRQSEVRIIINSKNKQFLDYIENNKVIDIGPCDDIIQIYDYYFEDLVIERKGKKTFRFNLPHEEVERYEDMSLERLLTIFIQLCRNEEPMVLKKEEKEKFIKTIKATIKNKFNLDVEYNNNNFLIYNADQKIFKYLQDYCKPYQIIKDFENKINNLLNAEKYDEALGEINKNIKEEKVSKLSNYYKGKISEGKQDYIKAIEHYTYCVDNEIKLEESLSSRSICLSKIKKYDLAIEDLKKLQEVIGYNPMIYVNKGINLINAGRLNDAINEFNASIKMKINNPEAFYNRSVAQYRLGNFKDAKEDIKQALKYSPENKYYNDMYEQFYKFL